MSELQLKIISPALSNKGKVFLIKKLMVSCSGKKTTYSCDINDNEVVISPEFKTQKGFDSVKSSIENILNNMCEEMGDTGRGCDSHYNCCDCGGNNCGCAYCFSCRACSHCLGE